MINAEDINKIIGKAMKVHNTLREWVSGSGVRLLQQNSPLFQVLQRISGHKLIQVVIAKN